MLVTLEGIVMLVSPQHSEKVHQLLLDQLGFMLPFQPPPEIPQQSVCGGDLLKNQRSFKAGTSKSR